MSQSPLPPPIPPPMQVLPYNEPTTSRARPSAISVMGTLAIVFGAWGLISGFFGSLMAFGFMAASTAIGNMPLPSGDFAGPGGFYVTEREIIVRAFHAKQTMTPMQQSQLAFLLSDVGTKIAPALPSNSTGDPAMDYLNNCLTGETGTMIEGGSGVWFDLPAGKLTVTDSDATFTPAQGSSLKPIKRSTIRTMPNPMNPSQLSTAEVQMVIDRIQDIAGASPLTPGQVASLRKELTANPAALIGTPVDMPVLFGQISSVIPSPGGGSVNIAFTTTNLTLSTGGAVSKSQAAVNGKPFPKMRTWPLGIVLTGSVLSLLLAVYLLVVGIITLRNSFYAPLLLRIYAWTKIVLALAVSAAGWWSWSEFWQGIMAQGGPVSANMRTNSMSIGTATAVATLVMSWALPITILVLIRTKAVKTFYAQSA